jgi:Trypsin-like peptidase domain
MLAKYQDAVITLKLVVNVRMSFGGQDQKHESKSETVGTIIDESGLTVISLSAIDPSGTFNQLVGQKLRRSGQNVDFDIESEVADVKLILADGTELPATVVLRDKDLDLAYIKPVEKPSSPFAHVDLGASVSPRVLDMVVAIHRLGKVANRVPTVSLERINALVERPRPFYVLGPGQGSSGVGSPVFSLDGKLLGLVLIRTVAPEGDANLSAMFSGSSSMGLLPIIVPTADIREGAKQAMDAAAKSAK